MMNDTRLELIKNAVLKTQFKNNLQSKNRLQRNSKAYKDFMKEETRQIEHYKSLDDNYNVWSDSEVFAKTHYKESYDSTTKFDNEWN